MRTLLEPYDFQRKIIERAGAFNRFAFFMDMGTGKTLVTINCIRKKWQKHSRLLKTLIFAPQIVLDNWKREFLLSTQVPEEVIGVVKGTTVKKRLAIIDNPDHLILVINYEALRTGVIRLALQEWAPEVMVCDESHRIKNPKSKTKTEFKGTFREVQAIARTSRYRYILTGTPIQNNFMDIFAQYLFLDDGRTFGENFFVFRNKYFINRNAEWQATGHSRAFPDWQLNPSMEKEIRRKIAGTSIQVKKEDCLDLPDLTDVEVNVPLSPEQERHYKDVRDELITWLDEQEENPLVVKNALTKILRLNEIASGYMRLENGQMHRFKENPRLDALMELLRDMHHKAIVFCIFKENYKQITEALKKSRITYTEIHGGVRDKEQAVQKFKDVQVCVANPKSAGEGVNLVEAKYAIFYTRDFNAKDFWQSRSRNYRAGSIDRFSKITHYHYIAPKTVDEKIYQAVHQKREIAKRLLDVRNLLTM